MQRRFQRPKDRTEVEHRETAGLWKAIALAKEIGESKERITLDTILRIHKTLMFEALPEAAGRFRHVGEDVQKLKCVEPPPGRLVQDRIYAMWRELDTRLAKLGRKPDVGASKTKRREWHKEVADVAAWAQHQIGSIHPFVEGNGRVARLLTNVILSRYGLPPTQVKFEGEDKAHYLDALCQADSNQDYVPLKKLILRGVLEVYKKEERIRKRKAA